MINKLITRIKETNAPIVVGLDPMMKFVPEYIKKAAFTEYGETLEGAAEAIWQYNKGIVDAIYDLVPAVKPQVCMSSSAFPVWWHLKRPWIIVKKKV
mgnify:CR=1 FL=1